MPHCAARVPSTRSQFVKSGSTDREHAAPSTIIAPRTLIHIWSVAVTHRMWSFSILVNMHDILHMQYICATDGVLNALRWSNEFGFERVCRSLPPLTGHGHGRKMWVHARDINGREQIMHVRSGGTSDMEWSRHNCAASSICAPPEGGKWENVYELLIEQ